MAHFAELDNNNIVLRVITFSNDEVNANGGDLSVNAENFVSARHGGSWKQTSYNNNFRKQYAGIGFKYDNIKDKFIRPKPYSSWSLDNNDDWKAPVEYSNNTNNYITIWNEEELKWYGYTREEVPVEFLWNPNSNNWEATGN